MYPTAPTTSPTSRPTATNLYASYSRQLRQQPTHIIHAGARTQIILMSDMSETSEVIEKLYN
jgi:hypothetical protein